MRWIILKLPFAGLTVVCVVFFQMSTSTVRAVLLVLAGLSQVFGQVEFCDLYPTEVAKCIHNAQVSFILLSATSCNSESTISEMLRPTFPDIQTIEAYVINTKLPTLNNT